MHACSYMAIKKCKNTLYEKVKHPQFWLEVLVVIAYFALCFYQELSHTGISGVIEDPIPAFQGGATFIFILTAFIGMGIGLSHGNSFFKPADINHLLVSPIRPEKILLYGLGRRLGAILLATLVLLTQLMNLRFYFGLGLQELLILMAAWFMLTFAVSFLSLGIYSVTATRPWIRHLIRFFIYATLTVVVTGAVLALWRSGRPVRTSLDYLNRTYLRMIPISGWTSGFLVEAMAGNWYQAAVYAAMLLVLPFIGLLLAFASRSSYYEDVVLSIGHTYGSIEEERTPSRGDVRRRSGKRSRSRLLGRRTGEVVLMQRQLTEQKRSLMVLFDRSSLGMLAIAVVLGAILRSLMRKGMYPIIMQIIGLLVLCYCMLFLIPMGRFVEELKKPFIFLMPGNAFRKLFYASFSSVVKALVEGVVSLAVLAFFARLNPAYVLCGGFFYTSAAMLFCAAYLASIRVLGLSNSKTSHMVMAFAIMTAVFLFEVFIGVGIGTQFYEISELLFPLVFVVTGAVNLVVSMSFFYSSRSILMYRD